MALVPAGTRREDLPVPSADVNHRALEHRDRTEREADAAERDDAEAGVVGAWQ